MIKKNDLLRVIFRLYKKEDIVRFEKFRKIIEIDNKSMLEVIVGVFKEYLYNKEKEIVFKDVLDDIYYVMRKVFYLLLVFF